MCNLLKITTFLVIKIRRKHITYHCIISIQITDGIRSKNLADNRRRVNRTKSQWIKFIERSKLTLAIVLYEH